MTTEQQQFGALPPAQPKKKSSGCMIIGLVALAALGGCLGLAFWGGKALLKAGEEISSFTDEVFAANAAGTWVGLYDTHTTSEFQGMVTREKWAEIGSTVQTKLGALKSKSISNINVRNMNGVTSAEVIYNAKFEKGAGTIEMTLRKDDGKWKFLGLHVKSPLLADAPTASPSNQPAGTCPHCGKGVPADSNFCPECGKAIGPAAEKSGVAENPEAPAENPAPAAE